MVMILITIINLSLVLSKRHYGIQVFYTWQLIQSSQQPREIFADRLHHREVSDLWRSHDWLVEPGHSRPFSKEY